MVKQSPQRLRRGFETCDCYVTLLIRGFMSPSSSWLGYRPFKAEARVRVPLEIRYLGWHKLSLPYPLLLEDIRRGGGNFLPYSPRCGEKGIFRPVPQCIGADAWMCSSARLEQRSPKPQVAGSSPAASAIEI